ncbi:MAG: hypothetical protein NVSMB22_04060 [Chloroflexota bacterium]
MVPDLLIIAGDEAHSRSVQNAWERIEMAQQIINSVQSSSTHVSGRALNSVGVHHFVIDGSAGPKEEITPADAFIAGISSCAVHLVERFAQDDGVPLQRVEVGVQAVREADDPSWFQSIALRVDVTGTTQSQAEQLVERFKRR